MQVSWPQGMVLLRRDKPTRLASPRTNSKMPLQGDQIEQWARNSPPCNCEYCRTLDTLPEILPLDRPEVLAAIEG